MADKRFSNRIPFRRRVRFGSSDPEFSGYTSNISENGIRIEAHKVFPPRSKVTVYIYMSGDGLENSMMQEIIRLEGLVTWASPTLPRMLSKMGIKFLKNTDITSIVKAKAVD
jgi:hypothetical protein